MQFRSRLLQRRAAAADTTLEKIYDVYMTPDGHFAAGEQEDAAKNAKPRNAASSGVLGEPFLLPKK